MLPEFEEVRIENTNACGYRCYMCPREKQTRKIGFMTVEDFNLALSKLPSSIKRMHLHGYGEPLLDPTLNQKVQKASVLGYQTYIFSTLGLELCDEKIDDLITSGLSYLRVSLYGFDENSYKKIHGTNKLELVLKNLGKLKHRMEKVNSNLDILIQLTPEKEMLRLGLDLNLIKAFLNKIKSFGFPTSANEDWHNYGDGRAFQKPTDKICPVVSGNRKKILQITYNLDVIPCCFDYDATIKLGNLKKQSLEDIFSSPEYDKFVLSQLMNDFSSMAVCRGCEKFDS
jgi:radical SAM protein with 4Fe4S-binding SPASM domain